MAWEDVDTDFPKKEEPENNGQEVQVKAVMLRDEFLINMQKFASSITRTIQQIEGDVRLEVPDLPLSDNIDDNLRNLTLKSQLDTVCRAWFEQVNDAMTATKNKVPRGNGPLAEIDHWRECSASYSALFEQLKQPKVQVYLEHFKRMGDNNLENKRKELSNLNAEAKDNVRFLTTLERHFKNITHGATFQVVVDTLPSMMNALRMVWIISRHYKDTRMEALMVRIAWELSERCARVITVRTLFKDGPEEVKKKTAEAKAMLDTWQTAYFQVREKIEKSGRDPRMEFNKNLLFDKTNYMASICQDLYNVAQVCTGPL